MLLLSSEPFTAAADHDPLLPERPPKSLRRPDGWAPRLPAATGVEL